MTETETETMNLELGDIIKIVSPINETTNNKTYIINYIDENAIKLIDVDTTEDLILNINEDGNLNEEYIDEIILLDRSEMKGYVKQNNLEINNWIDIYFTGDIPFIITGMITNIEEDMIEIITFENNETIYIDFAYQGIPTDLNIKEIAKRDKPVTKKEDEETNVIDDIETEDYELDTYIIPDTIDISKLQETILDADSIIIGEEIGEVTEFVTVDDKFKRYGIDTQTNDLLDELLSTIPTSERTTKRLNTLHLLIERYKQLRNEYSVFDENNNANKANPKGSNYKPFVNVLTTLGKIYHWILPVVTLQKKVYLEEIEQDIDDYVYIANNSLVYEFNQQKQLLENYMSNSISIDGNKHAYLYNQLDKLNTPYVNTNIELDDVISLKPTTDVFTVINNYDEFYTDVVSDDLIKKSQYVFHKFLEKEPVLLKGFITLPEQLIRYSNVDTPTSNIMIKSHLNLMSIHYWKLFNKKTMINNEYPSDDNFFKDIRYYDFKDFNESFLENKEKPLSTIMTDNVAGIDMSKTFFQLTKSDQFIVFVDSLIPKTKTLFNKIKKYINKPINFVNVIEYLEPFHIYKNDISFKQFQNIMFFIKENLIEYKKKLQEQKIVFSELKKNKDINIPNILRIFNETEKENLSSYTINNSNKLSSSEIITKLLARDDGKLFASMISLSNLQLIGMENFNDIISDQINQFNIETDCSNHKLSKKYTNESQLFNDNDKVIYYDKEFDLTDYKFIKDNYQKERDTLSTEEFLPFLSKKLQEKKKLSPEESVREAYAMIELKRPVSENIYAILINEDGNKEYFIRKNNKWIKDEDIQYNLTIKDKWDTLCDAKQECLVSDDKCVDGELLIKESILKNVLSEYDTQNAVNQFEMTESINSKILYNKNVLQKLNTINANRSFKFNDIQLNIGSDATTFDAIMSPHYELMDRILGTLDFVKKQNNIQQFAEKYTRLPFDDESEHWLYCNETSTKLLPKFLLTLANAYIQNTDYNSALQQICRDIGVLSDDGNSIVDKHSGHVIKLIEFDTDEGYDESGFKIKSRSELVEDLSSKLSFSSEEKSIKISPDTHMCLNVISAFENFMGISLESSYEFITSNVFILIDNDIGDEETYNKMAEEARLKKGKKIINYTTKKNTYLLLCTISYIFICVATMTPTPKVKKTFPGCKKSFKGFPLNNEDYSGLTYIACIATNIKSNEEPWNTLKKTSEAQLVKKLTLLINEVLLKNSVVKEKINNKLNYDLTEDAEIPSIIDVKTWETFLPPLSKPQLKVSENINDAFIKSTFANVSVGNAKQKEQLNVIYGKIVHFSMYIQIMIANIINNAEPLLMNSSKEPFIDNVCCSNIKSVADFLKEQNPNIYKTSVLVNELSKKLDIIDTYTKAATLFINVNTRKSYPVLANTLSESTVYKSFIVYCKFNGSIILDKNLMDICIDNKSSFTHENTIEEKINILKQESKFYSIETLHQLHRVIQQNIDLSFENRPQNNIGIILNEVSLQTNNNLPPQLVTLLQDMMRSQTMSQVRTTGATGADTAANEFKGGGNAKGIDTQSMRNIKNYLVGNNDNLKTNIKNFVIKNTKSSRKTAAKIDEFYNKIESLGDFKTHNILDDEDQHMYELTDHLSRYLMNITTIYPNMIKNNVTYNHEDITIHKHWNLSFNHQLSIKNMIKDNYNKLVELYDDILIAFMHNVTPKFNNIMLLANNIPRHSSTINDSNNVFDNKICALLYQHFVLLSLNMFATLSQDDNIISETRTSTSMSTESFEEKDNGDISQIEILIGEKKTKNQRLATLISVFIDMYLDQYSSSIYDYPSVIDKVQRSKDKEKEEFTTYLKDLSEDQRKVEDIKKRHQLEKWSKGLQKSLIQYDKDTFDEEYKALERRAIFEKNMGVSDEITEMNKDILMLDAEEKHFRDMEIEDDAYDMSNMHNDDDYDEDILDSGDMMESIRDYDD